MKLREVIKDFEKGEDIGTEELRFRNKEGTRYMFFNFSRDGEYNDIFITDIVRLFLNEDINTKDGGFIAKGDYILVEKYYETPTLYSHDMKPDEIINFVDKELKRMENGRYFDYISNFNKQWDSFEHLL